MTADQRRRRRGLSWRGLFLCCTLILTFFAGFTSLRLLFSEVFRPTLLSSRSLRAVEAISDETPHKSPTISIRETVIFPDQALVFVNYPRSATSFPTKGDISCVYLSTNSSHPLLQQPPEAEVDHDHQIVRCGAPPRGSIVTLRDKRSQGHLKPGPTYTWDSLAYEAIIDRDNSTVVFVKGLNLRSGRIADPSRFKCLYAQDSTEPGRLLWAEAVSAAQEVVRCRTPSSLLNNVGLQDPIRVSVRAVARGTINSVARVKPTQSYRPVVGGHKPHNMCVCTMLRNQARFLTEWIVYHGRIGVQRWFIYDNNSDDGIEEAVKRLVAKNYNVTRHLWPWIKSQEAGFAHCAVRARELCEWVAFIDVDEFFYLKSGLLSLSDVVARQSKSHDVGEIRVPCHSFGPSGLKRVPERGVTEGYTCRLASPERHKSIVRPEAVHPSLVNVVHHFRLGSGFMHVNANRSSLVINHYKYQVWDVFKEKFYRRVATYVSDWQQERNVGSKDRAPGLGTKAVEPSDWSKRFCEVRDTGLRDRVLQMFGDLLTGRLPWEDG